MKESKENTRKQRWIILLWNWRKRERERRDQEKGTCRTAWGQDTGLHPCQPHVKRSVVCTHLAIVCYLEDDLLLSSFTLLCWMWGPCNTHPLTHTPTISMAPKTLFGKAVGFRIQQGLRISRVQGSVGFRVQQGLGSSRVQG